MSIALQNKPIVGQVQLWPIKRILPNPLNPRTRLDSPALTDLVASIVEKGVVQPLLVTPGGDVGGFPLVHIVSGHRRRAAAEQAGLRELPVVVHRLSEQEQLELMLVENIQREDLTPLEEARAYERALGSHGSKADLARRLGVQLHRIESRLTLLRFEPEVAQLFDRGALPISYARAIARVPDAADQHWLASKAARGMTLRQLEKAVAAYNKGEREPVDVVMDEGGASVRRPPRDSSADESTVPLPPGPFELTRSQADALLAKGGGPVSFELLRGALTVSCVSCDEETDPELCKACPLPSYIAEVIRRAGRLNG